MSTFGIYARNYIAGQERYRPGVDARTPAVDSLPPMKKWRVMVRYGQCEPIESFAFGRSMADVANQMCVVEVLGELTE